MRKNAHASPIISWYRPGWDIRPASLSCGFSFCTLSKSKEVSLNLACVWMGRWPLKQLSSITIWTKFTQPVQPHSGLCGRVLGPTWMQLVWKDFQQSTHWLWMHLHCSDLVQEQLLRRTGKGGEDAERGGTMEAERKEMKERG